MILRQPRVHGTMAIFGDLRPGISEITPVLIPVMVFATVRL